MIKIRLSRLMGERREKIADLHRATMLSRQTISALYNEEVARVDLATLETLCKHFGCQISDLLEYQPDTDVT